MMWSRGDMENKQREKHSVHLLLLMPEKCLVDKVDKVKLQLRAKWMYLLDSECKVIVHLSLQCDLIR
jgi:hypothetical protein